jgi:hypothetical protein
MPYHRCVYKFYVNLRKERDCELPMMKFNAGHKVRKYNYFTSRLKQANAKKPYVDHTTSRKSTESGHTSAASYGPGRISSFPPNGQAPTHRVTTIRESKFGLLIILIIEELFTVSYSDIVVVVSGVYGWRRRGSISV